MAGIFDCWEAPGGECLYSYSIITVDSCRGLSDIHSRQVTVFSWGEFALILESRELTYANYNVFPKLDVYSPKGYQHACKIIQ
jgi:putative SOS response-associated peptidase YedK